MENSGGFIDLDDFQGRRETTRGTHVQFTTNDDEKDSDEDEDMDDVDPLDALTQRLALDRTKIK